MDFCHKIDKKNDKRSCKGAFINVNLSTGDYTIFTNTE